jgi:hypothetical protein
MKKKTLDQQIQELVREVNDTISRWKSHKENGCADPCWPDGVNMNLLRNHLAYYKREIKELCAENGILLPLEAYLPDLPYTDSNYFAKPESDRAQRIMSRTSWKCFSHEEPGGEYDDTVLTFL